jgi:hypothetical protein
MIIVATINLEEYNPNSSNLKLDSENDMTGSSRLPLTSTSTVDQCQSSNGNYFERNWVKKACGYDDKLKLKTSTSMSADCLSS